MHARIAASEKRFRPTLSKQGGAVSEFRLLAMRPRDHAMRHPLMQAGEAARMLSHQGARVRQERVTRNGAQALLLMREKSRRRESEARGELVRLLLQRVPVRRKSHRSLRRGGSALVGDQFGDRGVGLVPDGGDDRERASVDRLRHDALVERPQIFDRTAAAREEDGVELKSLAELVQVGDRVGDVRRGSIPLHAHIDEKEGDEWRATLEGVQHIVQRGASLRGDDRDSTREARQRLLRSRVKPAQRAQVVAQLAEFQFERARADRLDTVDIKLRPPLACKMLNAPARDDLLAVSRDVGVFANGRREHHTFNDCRGVFEPEVPVRLLLEAADFADDGQPRRQPRFERVVDHRGELRDGVAEFRRRGRGCCGLGRRRRHALVLLEKRRGGAHARRVERLAPSGARFTSFRAHTPIITPMSTAIQRRLIHHGSRFDFEQVTATLPGGDEVTREVVRHPGAVVVLALTSDHRIALIRNYRVALEEWVWELPAGTMEPPEPAIECARRELAEEAGWLAGVMRPIAEFYTTPGMTDELMHAFFATDLSQSNQSLENDERIEVHLTPVQEVVRMIDDGVLRDGKSAIAILLAIRQGLLHAE